MSTIEMKTNMKKILLTIYLLSFSVHLFSQSPFNDHDLQKLYSQWRSFEIPPLKNGAPDYTITQFKKRDKQFKLLQKRLSGIDTTGWSISSQVDWQLVAAEMNGYDFNFRILKPWERDPAFYQTIWMHQSDVPAHEGPTNHGTLEYWTYRLPLSSESKKQFTQELKSIPPFLKQAQANLTGNARDLWIAGIRNFIQQGEHLETIQKELSEHHSRNKDLELFMVLDNAKKANEVFIQWLEKESSKKNGPSGIGKDNYTWYQQNVHRVPLTWDEEVQLLQRELDRAWTSLKLEEQRNMDLPPMVSAIRRKNLQR
jgi:hypothetical protein